MKTPLAFHLLIAFLLSAIAGIAVYNASFRALDILIFDSHHRFETFEPADDIVIVAIDEQSLQSLGAWPWSRAYHGKLVEQLVLGGVERIVFDVIFAQENTRDLSGDASFASAMTAANNVYLPVFFEKTRQQGALVEVMPASRFIDASAGLGHVHIDCELGSLCRSVYLKEGLGEAYWPHISLALASQEPSEFVIPGRRADVQPDKTVQHIYRDYHNFVVFPKRAKHFKTASYIDVLEGHFSADQLKGATVFVGSTAAGLKDELSTANGAIDGVVANAVIYQKLRDGELIREVSGTVAAIQAFFLSFVILVVLTRLPPILFLFGTIASVLSVYLISAYFLVSVRIWFPWAAPMLVIAAYYPMWSWFKLQLALNHLKSYVKKLVIERNESEHLLLHHDAHDSSVAGSVDTQVEVVSATIKQFNTLNSLLEANRQLVTQTLSQLQEAVVLVDVEGSVILSNSLANTLFGKEGTESIEQLLRNFEVLEGQAWNSWGSFLASLADQTDIVSVELEQIKASSHTPDLVLLCQARWFDIHSETILPQNKLLFTFTDISHLKFVERSRYETLNFLSHDLRSPMVSILALITNIESGKNHDSLAENLERIRTYAQRNLNYSESILQLSRAEGVTLKRFHPCDMHAVIDAAYASVIDFAKSEDKVIIVSRIDEDIWVMGESELLERAVLNLLSNAIKYSPRGSQISLSINVVDGDVVVEVGDQGDGIDDIDLSGLFLRYQRGRNKRHPSGAGLGLYFVKTVAQKHSGSIGVKTQKGQGSLFTLTMPVYTDDNVMD